MTFPHSTQFLLYFPHKSNKFICNPDHLLTSKLNLAFFYPSLSLSVFFPEYPTFCFPCLMFTHWVRACTQCLVQAVNGTDLDLLKTGQKYCTGTLKYYKYGTGNTTGAPMTYGSSKKEIRKAITKTLSVSVQKETVKEQMQCNRYK